MIDWLIEDALIIDGTGNPPFLGDIAIRGDRIAEIGKPENLAARTVINAGGKVASPGFIDMHSHSDVLFLNGSSLSHKIYQGVTTELIGQDGMSVAPVTEASKKPLAEMIEPLSEHLEREWQPWDVNQFLLSIREKKAPVNVATLVGHCNLRLAVMGYSMGLPSREELHRMAQLLSTGLGQGAVGLSLGLIYPPSSYSDVNELIYLGKVVKGHDGILVAHIRNEQDQILTALEEMIRVGHESGCKIHISHLKCMGKNNWGRMPEILGSLDQALKEGIALSFDQYPYTAACTSLSVLLPSWVVEGGWEQVEKRLALPETLNKIIVELKKAIENRGGPVSITIASVQNPGNQTFVGKNLESIAREKGVDPARAALELLIDEKLQVVAIYHSIAEKDVERAMIHPLQTVGSDGILGEFPHPRIYGTFPRVIRHYSQERQLFKLEEAIRKMTSAPAKRLNLRDRGQIKKGFYADVLLFDPNVFRDTATFENPKQFGSGLDWMFVNGIPVVKNGELQEAFPGQIIKKEK
ncbi:MAG TPA: D-aminoacylase [Thermodesulfobacteriota bacterium]|nr:D-aminoacylase [Thermodesulfobacteriota bacterium]